MSKLGDEDFLYHLAYKCESIFEQLLNSPSKINSQLCLEFQQRFAIWAANLGVFARKSQSLDTRLRNSKDLQDLVARLLDILHRSLQQYEAETRSQESGGLIPISLDKSQTSVHRAQPEALKTIDDSLTRLGRLGVTIRRSGYGRIDMRVQQFAATLNLRPFESLCTNAVQTLYPDTHQSLKDYLVKLMIRKHERMLFAKNRQEKLETRREPRAMLSSIPEGHIPELQGSIQVNDPVIMDMKTITDNNRTVPTLATQSDLSSINLQQIRSRRKAPDEASTQRYETSSIQISRGNYPKPPAADGKSGIRACPWCMKILDRRLSESEWRKHVDQEFKPYACLAEECSLSHPSYSTFDQWFQHMRFHSHRWSQRIYLTSSWVCTICEYNPDVYSSPQALSSHIKESHHSDFTNEEIQVISRQSKLKQPRAWNNCLLCQFVVGEHGNNAGAVFPKRGKGEVKQEGIKVARKNLGMKNPDPQRPVAALSDSSSDSDDTSSLFERQNKLEGHSKFVPRHIAAHLQTLMLLTLRFADVCSFEEDIDGDVQSDYADVDEESGSSDSNDLRKLSTNSSKADIVSDVAKQDMSNIEEEIDIDIMDDSIAVLDTDIDLSDIPRQYDSLAQKEDTFLKGILQSGAFRYLADDELYLREIHKFILSELVKSDNYGGSFLPESSLSTVAEYVDLGRLLPDAPSALTKFIKKEAMKVFLITLLSIEKDQYKLREAVESFKANQLTDKSLPISDITEHGMCTYQCGCDDCSHRRREKRSWSCEHDQALDSFHHGWGLVSFRNFFQNQWSFCAPVFKKNTILQFENELPNGTILPFVGKNERQHSGHFSDIFHVKLHAAHQEERNLDGAGHVDIALKAFKNISDDEIPYNVRNAFHLEVNMLSKLPGPNHQHLIRPISAFKWRAMYYIMFEWANGGTLRTFCENNGDAHLQLTGGRIRQFLAQLRGISEALCYLHDTLHCRHGDLKPENILVFTNSSWLGNLKIAGFKWANQHDMATKHSTLHYKAPETVTHKHRLKSRKSDTWSIGCIIFEFILWLLYGSKAVDAFYREKIHVQSRAGQTLYYTTKQGPDGSSTASVSDIATNWIRGVLEGDPECEGATALHDLLVLVWDYLLVPEASCRASASLLHSKVKSIEENARANSEYLYTGTKRKDVQTPWTLNALKQTVIPRPGERD